MNKPIQSTERRYPEARLRRVHNSEIKTSQTQQWLAHESLIVYDMALKIHIGAMTLLPKRGYTNLRDQLERASLSIVLNIAEGAGRKSAADRRRCFTIAMGSLLECGALLEVLLRRRIAAPARCRNGRFYLIHTARMLNRLDGPAG